MISTPYIPDHPRPFRGVAKIFFVIRYNIVSLNVRVEKVWDNLGYRGFIPSHDMI